MLTAAASSGSTFAGWSGGGCTGTASTCTVPMTSAATVDARFNINTYTITITKTGSGTVTSSPAGITCGTTCTGTFAHGTSVTLMATPDAGYSWSGWGGSGPSVGCNGPPSCTFTIAGSQNITATFLSPPITIDVEFPRSGNGTVSFSPTATSCSSFCARTFPAGTPSVTLTATPAANNTFIRWTGACTGTGPCTVTADAFVSAEFCPTSQPNCPFL